MMDDVHVDARIALKAAALESMEIARTAFIDDVAEFYAEKAFRLARTVSMLRDLFAEGRL